MQIKRLLLSIAFAAFAVTYAAGQAPAALPSEADSSSDADGRNIAATLDAGQVQATTGNIEAEAELVETAELTEITATPVATGTLVRSGFRRLAIGDREFSFDEAGAFIEDPAFIYTLRHGQRLERVAIGLGAAGAVIILGGVVFVTSMASDDPTGLSAFFGGLVIIGPGALLGLTAAIIGAKGAIIISRAIRRYNYKSTMQLGIAATGGGLGLQLTF